MVKKTQKKTGISKNKSQDINNTEETIIAPRESLLNNIAKELELDSKQTSQKFVYTDNNIKSEENENNISKIPP